MGEGLKTTGLKDPSHHQTGSQLRAMESAELARLGEVSLREHLVNTAILAHEQYAPVTGERLLDLLDNRNLVRYPVRIAFEVGSMAPHQFAQPEPEEGGAVLYVHPSLQHRPGDLSSAIAYFIPVINYGSLINDDHCLIFGATLLGIPMDDYFARLCRIADGLDAPVRDRRQRGDRF